MSTATLEHDFMLVSPDQLAVHPDNLRTAYRGIDELAASIGELGVLVPLIVVPVAEVYGHDFESGVTHVVVDGNRRLLAARKANAAGMPCDVREDLTAARDTIRTMAVTSMVREGLTPVEEAKGVQLLLNLGMTQTAIAKATGRKTAEIKVAKAAAALTGDAAKKVAAADRPLTLADMAVIAEFQDDPEVVAVLIEEATFGDGIEHAAERFRREAAAKAEIAEATAVWEAKGYATTRAYSDGTPLHYLVSQIKGEASLTADEHEGCPGRLVYLDRNYSGEIDVKQRCADPAKFGHEHRAGMLNPSSGPASGPMTDAEKESRRLLVARNKEMVAAEVVRRRFIASVRDAKPHADQRAVFALRTVITCDERFTAWARDYPADTGLYMKIAGVHNPTRWILEQSAARWPQLLWLQVVTAIEASIEKDVHRWLDSASHYHQALVVRTGTYLAHLVSLGYTPCGTEQLLIDAAAKS